MAITINGTTTTFSDSTTQSSYFNQVDQSSSAAQTTYNLGHLLLAANVLFPDKWGTYDFGYTWTYTSTKLNQTQLYRRSASTNSYKTANDAGEPYYLWISTNPNQLTSVGGGYVSSTSIRLMFFSVDQTTLTGYFPVGDSVSVSSTSNSKFNGSYIVEGHTYLQSVGTYLNLTTSGTSNSTTFVSGDNTTSAVVLSGNLSNQAYAWTTTRYIATSSTKPGVATAGIWKSRGMTCDVGIDQKYLNVTLFQRVA